MATKPFAPILASTVNIDVSSSSARVAITGTTDEVRVMNNGTATAWIEFGNDTVTAAVATEMPVGPGVTEIINIGKTNANSGALYVAAIAAGSTGKIHFTRGSGI